MSLLLYQLFLKLYHLGIRLTARKGNKAQLWLEGRKDLFTTIAQTLQPTTLKRIWVHCASLGEFEQGRPIIERLKQENVEIVLTFFSPSGYEHQKNYDQADYVFYLPLDHPEAARKWVSIVKPDLAIFIKYEFWYFYLKALHDAQVPTFLAAATFRPSQPFFQSYGSLFRTMLRFYDHLFLQDPASQTLLASIDITQNLTIAGDTRYDRVATIAGQASEFPTIATWVAGHQVLIAGSTWQEDEQLLQQLAFEKATNNKLILAPHEIDEPHIQHLLQRFPNTAVRYSQLSDEDIHKRVLIIDNIGMLSSLYRYGTIAYVGGGFAKGGIHNILEPAVYGLPVFFGPIYQKFVEANELVALQLAFSISNATTMRQKIDELLSNEAAYDYLKYTILTFMKEKQGATTIIVNKALQTLGK